MQKRLRLLCALALTLFVGISSPPLCAQDYRPWFRESPLKEKMETTLQRTLEKLQQEPRQFPARARGLEKTFNKLLIHLKWAEITLADMSFRRDQNYCRGAIAFHGGADQMIVCPSGERFPEHFLVQILIHELTHIAGVSQECLATELAVLSSNFGQEIPAYANAYLGKVSSWLKYKTLKESKMPHKYDKHHCREVVKTYSFANI